MPKEGNFSRINYPVLKMSLRTMKGQPDRAAKIQEAYRINRGAALSMEKSKRDLCFLEATLLRDLMSGHYTNFFVESDSLRDFLESTAITDYSLAAAIVSETFGYEEEITNLFDRGALIRTELNQRTTSGVIHAPGLSRSECFLLTVTRDREGQIKQGILFCSDGDDIGFIHLVGEKTSLNEGVVSPFRARYQLVFNLFLYMDCFPEAVKHGTPDVNMPELPTDDGRPLTLVATPAIMEHGSVTPHFRRGHFRVLRSERFTKKRFQTVFVRSTFVRGHAETITDIDGEGADR